MNNNLSKLVAVAILVALVGFTTVAGAQPAVAKQTHSHGHEMKGQISTLDDATKDFKLKDAAGKETEFTWTTATQVHGTLKVGEMVTVRYMIKDAKNVATSIGVAVPPAPPAPAKAVAKPAASK
ncbi:MAG TPA: hypothetical protein PLS53_18350 [Thermoanaerobaculaceae bacterium]|nr:hypothetical protein [Thermoanaerobaculaceae bacterium]